MTAYRYVRTGRLPAHKSGGVWRVRAEDLTVLEQDPLNRADPSADRVRRLADRLAADDEPGALRIVTEARSAREPWRLHGELLAPALLRTRADGPDTTTARRADATMLRLLGRLAPLEPPRDTTGTTVVVLAPEHDHDQAAVAIVADHARVLGHDVIDLGPHTPEAVVADTVETLSPDAVVVVSETSPGMRLADLIPQGGENTRYPFGRPPFVLGGEETAPATPLGPTPAETGDA